MLLFSKSTKRTNILNTICRNSLPTSSNTRWNFTSRAVFTVQLYKAKLIEVFDFIIESDDFRNDAQTIREAVGLKNYLIDAKFCFLLDTFKLIFEQTEVIFSILQNKLTDINFARNRLLALIHILQEYRNNDRYFNDIYNNLHFDTEPSQKKRKLSYESEIKTINKSLSKF